MPNDFVQMRNPANDSVDEVPADAADAYEAKGWEKLSDPRPYGTAQQERADAEAAAALAAETATAVIEQPEEQTVAAVLAEVGDDPEKARTALEAEQSRDKPRKTLIDKLTLIAGNGEH